jgi:hypothetical protein
MAKDDENVKRVLEKRFDPDVWLHSGKNLLDWRIPPMTDEITIAYYSDHPELGDRVGRYLTRLAQMGGGGDQTIGQSLTEQEVRAVWNSTAHDSGQN